MESVLQSSIFRNRRPKQQQITVPGAKKALAQLHAPDLCATRGLSSTSNV